MRICVAQTRSFKGDIELNIETHKKLIELAVSEGANAIFFPELSITGYEPELAKDLATDQDDSRFDDFQKISNRQNVTIGVGMPTKSDSGIRISMLIFQPDTPRQTYSKQHLHADEYPYFVGGDRPVYLTENAHKMALAICYELSVPEHSETSSTHGANLYVASVAKTAAGVEKACNDLSAIARKYGMMVLMANSIGPSDNFVGAGNSAVWNREGALIGQLNNTNEGILIIDTETQEVIDYYRK